MRSKKALIIGISGQDGSYLSKFLLNKGYDVWGTSRNIDSENFFRLKHLDIYNDVRTLFLNPCDDANVSEIINRILPDEVYFLAGQSSVRASFQEPSETIQSNILGLTNVLESCRVSDKAIKIYNAGSSECFGDTGNRGANEYSVLKPVSPYGVSKAATFFLTETYRNAYSLFACTGILFNHESELRPEHFVTKKVISAVKRIVKGSDEKLILGNTNVIRDWGWAPEYVQAMWLMLQQSSASDFVIGTGSKHSLSDFVQHSFLAANLNWQDFVEVDNTLLRPTEILVSFADPYKAERELGWRATVTMPGLVQKLIND